MVPKSALIENWSQRANSQLAILQKGHPDEGKALRKRAKGIDQCLDGHKNMQKGNGS
jgi:hypothetical protein